MRRADNLTAYICWLFCNLGASTPWNPQGLSRPVMGLLYLHLYGSAVGTEAWGTSWTVQGSNPGRGNWYFCSSKCSLRLQGLPRFLFSRHRYSFPRVRRPGPEVNLSPLSSVEVKNVWSYVTTSPYMPSWMNRESFSFYILNITLKSS
jgi:hypothetical protein